MVAYLHEHQIMDAEFLAFARDDDVNIGDVTFISKTLTKSSI